MSESSWNNVREGDKVKVKHDQGAVIEGTYGEGYGDVCFISGLYFNAETLELLEHTPSFKNGDIGVITSHSTGSNFVGIYIDGTFYSSDSSCHVKVHTPIGSTGWDIKIVGNVYGT